MHAGVQASSAAAKRTDVSGDETRARPDKSRSGSHDRGTSHNPPSHNPSSSCSPTPRETNFMRAGVQVFSAAERTDVSGDETRARPDRSRSDLHDRGTRRTCSGGGSSVRARIWEANQGYQHSATHTRPSSSLALKSEGSMPSSLQQLAAGSPFLPFAPRGLQTAGTTQMLPPQPALRRGGTRAGRAAGGLSLSLGEESPGLLAGSVSFSNSLPVLASWQTRKLGQLSRTAETKHPDRMGAPASPAQPFDFAQLVLFAQPLCLSQRPPYRAQV